ncbi:MAG: T9SS type A sorting domain-containing protein [Ignavibacteriales bacterium]|nr:T9SS type A sorting domain-containing protein [Ignavibacteriales bacterium]
MEERIEQFGSDYGVAYSFKVSKDYLTNSELVKGKTYSFAISAYYVSKDVINGNTQSIITRRSYETPITVLSIQYRKDEAGVNYKDQLVVQSKLSYTKDNCKVYVTNPSQLTNHDYQINFKSANNDLVWNLLDKTLNKEILSNQSLVAESQFYLDSWMPSADGLQFLLIKANNGIRDNELGIVEVAYDGKALTSSEYDDRGREFLGNHVWNSFNYPGINNERDKYFLKSPYSGMPYSHSNNYYDYEIRFTTEGSYAVTTDKKIIQVPFEIWDIGVNTFNDNKDDYKLIPATSDFYTSGMTYWAYKLDSEANLKASPRTKALKIINKNSATADYDAFKNACIQSGGVGKSFNMSYDNGVIKQNLTEFSNFVFVDADKDGNPPPAGTVVRIITKKGLSVNDLFEFNKSNFTDVAQQNIPTEFSLEQNYPNPFNPETTIRYKVQTASKVSLKVYDALGREIATLVDEVKQPGIYNSKFSIRNSQLTSGVYFYILQAGEYISTKKMVLLK